MARRPTINRKVGFIGIRVGTRVWWKRGKLHRLDGPALEHPDGSKFWYVNNSAIMWEDFWGVREPKEEIGRLKHG